MSAKLVSMESESVSTKELISGTIPPQVIPYLTDKIKSLLESPLYVDECIHANEEKLIGSIRSYVLQKGVKVVVIDYLQVIKALKSRTREEEVGSIMRTVFSLCKELGIIGIILSQFSRDKSRGTVRPKMSDMRDSGTIEQVADFVYLIHRPEYYGLTEDEEGNSVIGLAEVIQAKGRNAGTNIFKLRFIKEYTKFKDYYDPESTDSVPEATNLNEFADTEGFEKSEDDLPF